MLSCFKNESLRLRKLEVRVWIMVRGLVTNFSINTLSQNEVSQKISLLSYTFSGWEIWRSFKLDVSDFSVLQEPTEMALARTAPSQGLTRASSRTWLSAGLRRTASKLTHVPLCPELPQNLATCSFQTKQFKREWERAQRQKLRILYNRMLEATPIINAVFYWLEARQ